MADCGATGSAVDRVSRAFGGDGLANLLTTSAAGVATALPEAPPEFLPPLQQQSTMSQATASTLQFHSTPVRDLQAPMAHHLLPPSQQQANPAAATHTAGFVVPQQHNMQLAPPMLSPQHMVMQMQQQQAMMGAMLQQQLQKQQLQQQQQQQQGIEGTARPATIQELSQAWEEATTEGAKPATIEELSSAWLEANEDWQAVADELSDLYGLDAMGNPESYEFRNKPTTEDGIKDWMQQGMKSFQSGDIADAIYAFEMELQSNNSDNGKAWRMLGHCHAEQDMDRDAILCLEHSVEVDPYDISARLALGVSYVNELEHSKALEHLKAWVTHNPQLSDVSGVDIYGDGTPDSPFDEVQHLLLSALHSTQDSQALADIHTALGVVYNVSRDYDAAIDAFQRATNLTPENYQLWNKLGATMANHNQSEEALRMYRRALDLKPKYARAWLNKAISHANLQQYEAAASCYLQTLSLNPSASHCWSYLRVAVSCAERNDLIPLVAERNLNELRLRFGLQEPLP